MATSNHGSDWMSRMQKRNDLAMAMLKRPSKSDARSNDISSEQQQIHPPTSSSSSHSAGTSSLSSVDDAVVLELQVRRNEAQIKANEERMLLLQAADDRMGREIQERMSAVMQLNQQLDFMRDMLARAERVSSGGFGIPSNDF